MSPPRAGRARFTDFYGNRSHGYYRALLLSLAPEAGRPGGRGPAARPAGVPQRIRWVILGGYTGALVLALVLSALFIPSILRPHARLTALLAFAKPLRLARVAIDLTALPSRPCMDLDRP